MSGEAMDRRGFLQAAAVAAAGSWLPKRKRPPRVRYFYAYGYRAGGY